MKINIPSNSIESASAVDVFISGKGDNSCLSVEYSDNSRGDGCIKKFSSNIIIVLIGEDIWELTPLNPDETLTAMSDGGWSRWSIRAANAFSAVDTEEA